MQSACIGIAFPNATTRAGLWRDRRGICAVGENPMAVSDHVDFGDFMNGVKRRNPHQDEFVQAVQEVAEDIFDFIADKEDYHQQQILRRIAEPDRVVSFRVCWEDDAGNVRVQRGWRVQNNNAIGPYKGGIRFHPSVTESVLKFLAFEQTFKNALTGLPMGGGKGGSNFNPKGKSVRRLRSVATAQLSGRSSKRPG